jgi:release factor glutamine methyltransferase
VDLCCGSGALGAAVANEHAGGVELHASDIDPVAVACARGNVEPFGGVASVGDMADALPSSVRGSVDLLLANVPYVPTSDIALLPREARDHEPRHTLDGGEDGLDLARGIAELAPSWLTPGGHVLVEVTPDQAPMLIGVFEWAGLAATIHADDELDATIVVGTRHA